MAARVDARTKDQMENPPPFSPVHLGRFSLLLVAIILNFAIGPFLDGWVRIKIVNDLFLSVILLSALHAVSRRRSHFFVAVVLACPFFFFKWAYLLFDSLPEGLWAEGFGALFTAAILVLIGSFIVGQKKVTSEVLMAAVCGYFLLGFMWSFIYFFLESAQPGSFQVPRDVMADQGRFIYFSFVTMTTVGYGDITPLSNAARSLAVLQAVMGQLYLAVTIGRLVGTYLSQKTEKPGGGVPD